MAARSNYQRSAGSRGRSGTASRVSYGAGVRTGRERQKNTHGSGAYVYDNLARQLEEVPERRRRPQRRRRVKVYPRQRPVAMPSISGAAFLFLFVAVAITMAFCFRYLMVQSGITQMKNEVVSLQEENAEMELSNGEAYQEIMDTVDLSEVYRIATGELGMVQAVDNQVYRYKNRRSNMVKQYGDIPGASK